MQNIVRRLRRKLDDNPDDPTYIFAEPNVGYWMAEGGTREQGRGVSGDKRAGLPSPSPVGVASLLTE